MFNAVRRCVDEWLAANRRPAVRPDRVIGFDVTNRGIDGCCYLVFGGREDAPELVAKAARTPAGIDVLEIEYENLRTLERVGLNADRPRAPAALGRWTVGDTRVTLQTALEGTLMKNVPGDSLFSPQAAGATLDLVLDWWRVFQERLGTRPTELADAVYRERILAEVERFRRRFLLEPDEERFLERRFVERPRLLGARLPLMVRHGDFCAANMMLAGEQIGVFDWEFPLRHETPLFDLFFFASSLRFPFRGARRESDHFTSFVSTFWDESYFSLALRERLRGVRDSLEIAEELMDDLFAFSLIQIANMKFRGLIESHGLGEDPPEGPRPSNERKRALWSRFREADKNAPFARIRAGVFENLRHLVRHGRPRL